MPFKKQHYHHIPDFIKSHFILGLDAQKVFINSLSEDELLYLITPFQNAQEIEAADKYPTPLHELVSHELVTPLSEAQKLMAFLFDKFLEIQSKKSESKEAAESQKKIFDGISHLSASCGSNLLHLLSNDDASLVEKFLHLVSSEALAAAALQNDNYGTSGFSCVAQIGSRCFIPFLEKLTDDVVEKASKYVEPVFGSGFAHVVADQDLAGFQAYSKKLSIQAKIDLAKMKDKNGTSGFALLAKRADAAFQTFIEDFSGEFCNEVVLRAPVEGVFSDDLELYQVIRCQNSSAFFAFFNKLSPAAKDHVFSFWMTVMKYQSFDVVRLFIDNIRCPFRLVARVDFLSWAIDQNKNLLDSVKKAFKEELYEMFSFVEDPAKAVREKPADFLKFVSKYFPDTTKSNVNYAKWYLALHKALNACDINNKEIYEPLVIFTIQAEEEASSDIVINKFNQKVLQLRLFGVRETQFLNANDSFFVGEYFTRYGSPFQDANGRLCSFWEDIALASENYNAIFKNGLEHLKKAAESKNTKAELLLTKILVPFELSEVTAPIVVTERKSEPEDKAKPSTSEVTLFRNVKSEDKQSDASDKKFKEMIEKLNQRIDHFDKINWDKLSSQFKKAATEKFDTAETEVIEDLAILKNRIESAETGSADQKKLLEEFHTKVEDAIRYNPSKHGVLLSFILTDPYAAWLNATQAITRECRHMYYERHATLTIALR